MRWRERRHCPHSDVRGIYGDEIIHTPGFRRMECRDCGRLLDGPVGIAAMREVEAARMKAYRASQESGDPS